MTAPIELQIASATVGLGVVYFAFSGIEKVWNLLFPIRWLLAGTLRVAAHIICKKSKKTVVDSNFTKPLITG